MSVKSIVVDSKKCTGCRTCEMACSLVHEGACSPQFSRVRVVKWEAHGISVPVTCADCTKPYCMEVCPVGAVTFKPDLGSIIVDENRCIGCRACSMACPLGHAGFHPVKRKALKCDLCDGDPACAKYCPSGAINYTTMDEMLMAKRREFYKKLIQVGGGH